MDWENLFQRVANLDGWNTKGHAKLSLILSKISAGGATLDLTLHITW